MNEKTYKIYVVCFYVMFAISVILAIIGFGYDKALRESQATARNLTGRITELTAELENSRRTIDNLGTEIDGIRKSNQRATDSIRSSIRTTDTIEGIIDAIIAAIDELEKAINTEHDNF